MEVANYDGGFVIPMCQSHIELLSKSPVLSSVETKGPYPISRSASIKPSIRYLNPHGRA